MVHVLFHPHGSRPRRSTVPRLPTGHAAQVCRVRSPGGGGRIIPARRSEVHRRTSRGVGRHCASRSTGLLDSAHARRYDATSKSRAVRAERLPSPECGDPGACRPGTVRDQREEVFGSLPVLRCAGGGDAWDGELCRGVCRWGRLVSVNAGCLGNPAAARCDACPSGTPPGMVPRRPTRVPANAPPGRQHWAPDHQPASQAIAAPARRDPAARRPPRIPAASAARSTPW